MGTNFDKEVYEQEKAKLKITYCDECRGEFILTNDKLLVSELNPKGEHIAITYFVCPHCNKLYKIAIDNMKTANLKQLIECHVNNLARARARGKEITQTQIDRVNKYRKLLTKEYARLDSTYNGSFYQKSEQDTN
jgi:hypothetical protein